MNKKTISKLAFFAFSLAIAALILTHTLEVPIAVALWIVGMLIFTGKIKRRKKEEEKPQD